MSFRGLLIGAVLLAVLAGAVYWSEKHPQDTSAKATSESPKLITLKDEDVTRVEIKRKDSEPVVVQREKSGWQITAPRQVRTDAESVTSVVSAASGLTWDRLVEEKAPNPGTFGLAAPAIEVSLTGKDKRTQTVQIGDETPTGGGYFAKLAGDPRVFSINSGTKGSLDKSWKDLRDKRLLTVDDSKVSRVEVTGKGAGFELGRSGQSEWQILKPRPMRADSWQVEELLRKVREARMEPSASDEDEKKNAAAFASASKMGMVAVTDPSGTQSLDVRKSGEDYLARSSAVEGTWKVNKDLAEGLNKGVEDFRNKKLFDFGFSEPSKIEIRDGAKTYSFSKSGDKWWSGGKQMDATGVQSLIDKLRDLSASKFVESGFGSPVLDISVTSMEGKRTEKVSLAKSANTWLGKRDNEPAIYELDSKRVEELQGTAGDVKPPPAPAAKK